MAEKISVQIALEGGAEVQRQLEGIGEAGQKAFEDISKSAEQVGGFKNLKPEEVTSKLEKLGLAGTEAFGKIQQAVQTAVRFETIVQGVQSIETAFVALGRAAGPVGALIAAGLTAAAKATIAFSATLGKASDDAARLGLSLAQLKALQADFSKAGVSAQSAAAGIAHFQKEMQKTIDQADPGSNLRLFGDAAVMTEAELARFQDRLRQMPHSLERTNLAVSKMGQAFGTEFIQGLRRAEGSMGEAEAKAYDLQQALRKLGEAWEDFGSVTFAPPLIAGVNAVTAGILALHAALERNPWGFFLQAASAALNPIAGLVQQATKAIAGFVSSITGISWESISSGAQTAWQAVTGAIAGAVAAVSNFASTLGSITWASISGAGVAAWEAVTAAIQGTIDMIERAIAKFLEWTGLGPGGAASAAGGGAAGMAHGGFVGGRGTGTSDSNLAWVSRGEHIMPARAVQRPGVLAFLEALRRSGGNLRGVLDGMGRFALGGLVPRPAFAAGGMVGAGTNLGTLTLGLPSGGSVSVRASAGVVETLRREAALAQVRSGGRKPSRYS